MRVEARNGAMASYEHAKKKTLRVNMYENQGAKGVYQRFKASRSYLDKKTNEWKSEFIYLFKDEVEMLIEVLKEALDSSTEMEQNSQKEYVAEKPKAQAKATINMDEIPF